MLTPLIPALELSLKNNEGRMTHLSNVLSAEHLEKHAPQKLNTQPTPSPGSEKRDTVKEIYGFMWPK